MKATTTCDTVNWQMTLVGLEDKDAKIIQTCVGRYTYGEGVGEKLT